MTHTLRLSLALTVLFAALVGGVRLYHGLATPAPAPLDWFTHPDCDDPCWVGIQLGSTTIDDSTQLLRQAGAGDIRPFQGEMVYAGLAINMAPEPDFDFEHDAFVTAGVDDVVYTVTLLRDACMQNVLLTWGVPDEIQRGLTGAQGYRYLYHTPDGIVVQFISLDGQHVQMSALYTPEAHELHGRAYLHETVRWRDVEHLLRAGC